MVKSKELVAPDLLTYENYNDLRKDVLDPTLGHSHLGGTDEGRKLAGAFIGGDVPQDGFRIGHTYFIEAESVGYYQRGSEVADPTASGGKARKATSADPTGYIIYGPYKDDLPGGNYQAIFRLKVASNVSGSQIGTIDVLVTRAGGQVCLYWYARSRNCIACGRLKSRWHRSHR